MRLPGKRTVIICGDLSCRGRPGFLGLGTGDLLTGFVRHNGCVLHKGDAGQGHRGAGGALWILYYRKVDGMAVLLRLCQWILGEFAHGFA